ncbi:MAG: phosphoadenylyl-sulfate reductase [Pseudomonadota bacterium]
MSNSAAAFDVDDCPPSATAEGLACRAQRLSMQYGSEDAETIIRAGLAAFPGRIALVSSFGAESVALLHLAARVDPTIPVIFLDTGKHFAQTLSYRKKLAARLGLTNVRDVTPNTDELTVQDPKGDLWRRDTDACCALRKSAPLSDVLQGFDAWITGRKQFHGGDRMHLPAFENSGPHIKVNPLIRWNAKQIAAYIAVHELPAHPLVAQGYPSIGCWPCTKPAASGENVRAGRWRGAEKTECGIHTSAS